MRPQPFVVGLYSPRPQSGKSTTARAIAGEFVCDTFKISGAMKAMTAALLESSGIPAADIPRYVDGDLKEDPIPGLVCDDGRPLTSRDIQKTLGLEWGRTLFGGKFWTRPVAAEIATAPQPVAIVDDIRFEEDFDLVQSLGGINVRIDRADGTLALDGHKSEGLLDGHAFDVMLANDGDLATFEARIAADLLPRIAEGVARQAKAHV